MKRNFKPEDLSDRVAIDTANEEIAKFAKSGKSSPSFEYIQQELSKRPHNTLKLKSGDN